MKPSEFISRKIQNMPAPVSDSSVSEKTAAGLPEKSLLPPSSPPLASTSRKADLEQMRADYRIVKADLLDQGWTEAEIAEGIDAGLTAAINRSDDEIVRCWASWLAERAQWYRNRAAIVAGVNETIRAKIACAAP